MRLLRRNLQTFEYLPFVSEGGDEDENGDHTGEYGTPVYGDPVSMKGNISVPSGQANQTFYGLSVRYTHILLVADHKADIRENGLIRWNGDLYDITAVAPSLNVLSVALQKQTKDYTEPEPEPGPGPDPDEPVDPDDPDTPTDPSDPNDPSDPGDPDGQEGGEGE